MARKAAISFGMVHIPVKYENATQENDISFNLLHKKCGQRLKNNKSCPACGIDEVAPEDIVKGYEYEKDKFVIIEDTEFEDIKSEKDKTIKIEEFVYISEIDPIFYNKSYYLYPDGSDDAFALLKAAVEEEGKVAIAKTVLGTKETTIGIRAQSNALILQTMFMLDEIRPPQQAPKGKINPQELEMAILLIRNMTKKFDPSKYKNEYQQKLKALITDKIQGDQTITQSTAGEFNALNLADALQASLQGYADQRVKEPAKKPGRRKKTEA